MANSQSTPRKGEPVCMTAPDVWDYYLCQGGAIYGPVDMTRIAMWIGEGRVSPRDWLFVPSLCDWMPILEVPDMAGCFYNVVEKPIGPPPGLPVEVYLKYYRTRQDDFSNDSDPKLVEKRQWVRIPLSTSMTFWDVTDIKAELSEKHEAYTVNISEGGLAFEWTKPVEPGKIIELRVDFYPVTLRAMARVAHCDPKGSGYQMGVAFRNLAVADRDKIRHFIRTCLHTASRGVPG